MPITFAMKFIPVTGRGRQVVREQRGRPAVDEQVGVNDLLPFLSVCRTLHSSCRKSKHEMCETHLNAILHIYQEME